LIIIRTELVIDSKIISQLDESLAARIVNWRGWSRRRIINAVDAAVRVADPDAARERRLAAEERDRHISVTALPDGLARVSGTVATTAGPGRHELPTRASKTAPNGPSTKSTGASGEPENTKSKRASSEITCGACYFSSKVNLAPARSADGSMTRLNPKSCRRTGSHRPSLRLYRTTSF
jgi:hypothetical protein